MNDFKTFHDDPIEKSERSALGNAKYRGAMPNFPKNGNDRQVAKYFDEVREAGFHKRLVPIFEESLDTHVTNRKIVATVTITEEEAIFYLARTAKKIDIDEFVRLMLYHIFKFNAYYDEYSNHAYDLSSLTIEQKTMLMFYKMCLYHSNVHTQVINKELENLSSTYLNLSGFPVVEKRNPEFYQYLKNLPDEGYKFSLSDEDSHELLECWNLFSKWLDKHNYKGEPPKKSTYGIHTLEQLGLYCNNLMVELPNHPLPMKYFIQDLVREADVPSTTFNYTMHHRAVFRPISEEEFMYSYGATSKYIPKRVKMVRNFGYQVGVGAKYQPENYNYALSEDIPVLKEVKKLICSGGNKYLIIKNELTQKFKLIKMCGFNTIFVFETNDENMILADEPYYMYYKLLSSFSWVFNFKRFGYGFELSDYTNHVHIRKLLNDIVPKDKTIISLLKNTKMVRNPINNLRKLRLDVDDRIIDTFDFVEKKWWEGLI